MKGLHNMTLVEAIERGVDLHKVLNLDVVNGQAVLKRRSVEAPVVKEDDELVVPSFNRPEVAKRRRMAKELANNTQQNRGVLNMNLQLLASKNTNNNKGEMNMNNTVIANRGLEVVVGDVLGANVVAKLVGLKEEIIETRMAKRQAKIAKRMAKLNKVGNPSVNKREAGIVTPKQKKASNTVVMSSVVMGNRVSVVVVDNKVAKVVVTKTTIKGLIEARLSALPINVRNIGARMANVMPKMNLQLLASGSASASDNNKNNGGNEMRDLTNVPNAGKIVQEKSSVILRKRKGVMAGLVIRTNKKGEMGVNTVLTACPENKYTRKLEGVDCTVKVGNSVHTFTKDGDRFLDKFLTVSIDSASAQAIGKESIYVDFTRNIIAIPTEDKNGATVYRNINTGRTVKIDRLNKYSLALATASGLRAKKQLFNAVYVLLENDELVSDILNKNCHNIIKHANKKMTKDTAAKFMTRPGLGWTGSKSLAPVNCLGRLNGRFDCDFARNTFDGVAFTSDVYIASVLNISVEEARKVSLQSRPGGVIKVQLKVLPEETFKALCKKYKKEGNLVKHGNGDIEILYDNNSIKADIDVTDIELEVLAFGKTSNIGFAKQMLEKAILEATRMDKENPEGKMLETLVDFITNLGKQEIVKVLSEIVVPSGKLSPDVDRVYDIINALGERTIPAAKKAEMQNALKRIAKLINKLGFNDGNIYYSVIYTDTAQLFGAKVINEGEVFFPKMRYKDGAKCIGIKFPSMGAKEYYSAETISYNTVCERLDAVSDEILPGYLKKAIKSDFKTMSDSLVVVPASRAVFDSCAGMDIDMDPMALVFSDIFVEILHGKEEYVTLVSEDKDAKKEKQKRKEKETFTLSNSLAKRAEKGDKRAEEVLTESAFNPERDIFYSTMFSIPVTSVTKSIGEITFDNNKAIAVATEAVKGNFAPLMALLKENVGTNKATKAIYEGLPVTHAQNGDIKILSEATIDAMLKEIKETSLTEENMIDMAMDLSRCFRLYQETTIDAAKTGLFVKIAVLCRSVMAKSLIEVKYVETEAPNGVRMSEIKRVEQEIRDIQIKIDGENVTVKPIVIEDDMSKIQDELIAFTKDRLDEAVEDFSIFTFKGLSSDKVDGVKDANGEYVYDMSGKLSRSIQALENKAKGSVSSLLEVKSVYNTLAAEFNSESTRLLNEDASEEEMEALRNQFDAKLENLSNAVEKVLSNIKGGSDKSTMVLRGAILVGIGALSGKNLISNTSSNRFAFNVAPHYALAYALNDNQYSANCTVLYCAETVQEGEIKLVNGFSEDNSLIVKENFSTRENGEAIVNVTRLEDGTVEVTESKTVEMPQVDKSKAVMMLESTVKSVVDENGKEVKDASGVVKKEVVCESGKVLDAIRYGVKATVVDEATVKFAFELNGKEHAMTIPTSRLKFTDVKIGDVYNVSYGYFVDGFRASRVVLELTK